MNRLLKALKNGRCERDCWADIPACPAGFRIFALLLALIIPASAETLWLQHGIIHTVSNGTITNGSVVVQDGKIARVVDETKPHNVMLPSEATPSISNV